MRLFEFENKASKSARELKKLIDNKDERWTEVHQRILNKMPHDLDQAFYHLVGCGVQEYAATVYEPDGQETEVV